MEKSVTITRSGTKKKLIEVYNALLKTISILPENPEAKYHDIFWNYRADLELICVELKFLLKKPFKAEKWQQDFLGNLTATKSLKVAKERLMKINKSVEEVEKLFEGDLEECYKYIWKVKELLTSILGAFPPQEIIRVKGKYKLQSTKTFEI